MPVDLTALAAELTAGHPVSGVYNADAALAAAQINALDVVRVRANMTGAEIFAATDPTNYNALTADQKNQWLAFCGISDHDPAVGGLAQQFVVNLFGGGSATVSNLGTLRNETISRAQELGFGLVREGDILAARAI